MKIAYLPYQPHCFAFGGFELQILSAFDAIKKLNIDVEKLDVWQRTADFDILHCWGLDIANFENVYWAKKKNKKVVVTALLNYYESSNEQLRFYLSRLVYRQRLIKEMIPNVDAVVVVNDKQADICKKYLKIPLKRIHVIPHIVDEKFFNHVQNGVSENYVLCVGNICKRKNQINLAKACYEDNIPLKLVGSVLDGQESYARELNSIITKTDNISWIKSLPENSDNLLEYFSNCKAMALPSFIEQQPISLLEAAVLNKPLIIADKAYAKQKYYANSCLVDPYSVASIKEGIKKVYGNPEKYLLDREVLNECKGENAAKAYINIYESLVRI